MMNPALPGQQQVKNGPDGEKASEDSAKRQIQAQRSSLVGILHHIRDKGERITGGGLRALARRLALDGVRRISRAVRRRPRVLAGAQKLLRPFPEIGSRLTKLALVADPFSGQIYIPSGRLSRFGDATALTLSTSARILYLRLRAEASDAASWNEN